MQDRRLSSEGREGGVCPAIIRAMTHNYTSEYRTKAIIREYS